MSANSRKTAKPGIIQQGSENAEAAPLKMGISLSLEYICASWAFPVFTGVSLRPQFPPSEGFACATLLLHMPRREADDLRAEPEDAWAPEFARFPVSE